MVVKQVEDKIGSTAIVRVAWLFPTRREALAWKRKINFRGTLRRREDKSAWFFGDALAAE